MDERQKKRDATYSRGFHLGTDKKKKRRHVKCKSMMDEEERAIEGRQGGLQLEKVAVRE